MVFWLVSRLFLHFSFYNVQPCRMLNILVNITSINGEKKKKGKKGNISFALLYLQITDRHYIYRLFK